MFDLFPVTRKAIALMALFLSFIFTSNIHVYAQEIGMESLPTGEDAIATGRSIYRAECQMCHQMRQRTVGPPLENVLTRRPIPWLMAFIRNSQQLIQSGDEAAVQIFIEYNRTPMPSFQFLSDDEILSILAYINMESEAAPPPVAAEPGVIAEPTVGVPGEYVNIILIGILVVLVLILIVLAMIISTLTKYLNQRGDMVVQEKKPGPGLKKFITSLPFIGIVTFVFVAIITKVVIDQLYLVGVQEGYAPTQPVWFSHQVHAGTYQIDCNYCHTGAQVSASAGIPSVNVCMNCHDPERGGIVTGEVYGETELAKVINAFQNNEPIQWIRVHNLPDLSYFNHAQHVTVGDVDCQTCHGPIEEMDVVRQHASLTMGWCIDCHRTTPLNVQGNEYYDKLVEMHEQLGRGTMLVQDIGGTECSKCHY
jgi:mono/diheme cytochrome c family protein